MLTITNFAHRLRSMRSKLDNHLLKKWSDSRPGGRKQAALEIIEALKCSVSAGEKLAAGRYGSLPSPLSQEALVNLTGLAPVKLFRPVSAGEKSK